MSDLISRSALLEDINFDREAAKVHPQEMCERLNRFCDYAEELVKDAPAVDAEPMRHGKRTVYTIWHSSAWGEIHTKFECCGFDVTGTKKYNYCPNCGAKMDGEHNVI